MGRPRVRRHHLNVYGHVFEMSGDKLRAALDDMIAAVPRAPHGQVISLHRGEPRMD